LRHKLSIPHPLKKTRKYIQSLVLFVFFLSLFVLPPNTVLADQINHAQNVSIKNFGEVSQDIWRGAVPSDRALEELAAQGIKTVIDLRFESPNRKHEEQTATHLGLKYVHLPIGFGKASCEQAISFLKVVSNPTNLPVFVHCHQGADRTGTLIGIYRIFVQNWTFDQTYKEMRSYHFKPWLFGLKKSVSNVADNELTRHAIKISLNDEINSMPNIKP